MLRVILSIQVAFGNDRRARRPESVVMSVEAPVILDVRASGFGAGSRIVTLLRGIGVRQVRLACGLVMFSYILSHFFNHALGNISYAVMEAWLHWHIWWWRIPLVNGTLYTAAVIHNVAYLNHQFASEVVEPIQYGIGIHADVVIVGDIGFRGHTVFTALGDAVNVASRLQDLTKELDCKVVVSEEVCKTAGPAGDALTRRDVAIRRHDGAMAVRTAVDPTVLASLVDPVAESDEPLPTAVAAE
jgi:hypothetical protein